MDKIAKFEDFLKTGKDLTEEHNEMGGSEHSDEQYYMFFQNLASIKHYIDEIMKYDPADIDALLRQGHDWAADHIATSKDDISEVGEWIRNEMGDGDDESDAHHDDIHVSIEGDDDKVEIEDEEEDDEESESGDNGEDEESEDE